MFSSTKSTNDRSLSEFESSSSTLRRLKNNKRKEMQRGLIYNLAIISYRTGVSDKAASIIAFVVLEGGGCVSKCDSFLVIDRSKVRIARKRIRLEVQE